jgi:hypothetical protein
MVPGISIESVAGWNIPLAAHCDISTWKVIKPESAIEEPVITFCPVAVHERIKEKSKQHKKKENCFIS